MSTDQSATRPAGLYVVGIGSMLFGLLGLCTQGFTIVSTAQQRDTLTADPTFANDQAVQQLVELQSWTVVPSMVSASVGVVIALALLIFGALTVARIGAALWMPAMLVTAAVVELLQLGLSVYVQMRMADMMSSAAGGMGGSGLAGDFDNIMSTAMGIGMCLLGGWALGKCAFFGASFAYLGKPEIRALFEVAPQLSSRGD